MFLRVTRSNRTFSWWRISLWSLPPRPNGGAAALNRKQFASRSSDASGFESNQLRCVWKKRVRSRTPLQRQTVLRFSVRSTLSTFDPETRSEDARRRFCDQPQQFNSAGNFLATSSNAFCGRLGCCHDNDPQGALSLTESQLLVCFFLS